MCAFFQFGKIKSTGMEPSITVDPPGDDFVRGASFSKHCGILGHEGLVSEYAQSLSMSWFFSFYRHNDYNLMDNLNLGGREEDDEPFEY